MLPGLQCLSAVSALLGRVAKIVSVPVGTESPMPFGRKCITGEIARLQAELAALRLQCLSAVSALLGRHSGQVIQQKPREVSPMPFGRKCITGDRTPQWKYHTDKVSPMPFGRKCITGSKQHWRKTQT